MSLAENPLDIVTACRSVDLPVLKVAYAHLRKFVPFKQLHVATAARNFRQFQATLGSSVHLIDEDSLIPSMKLAELKSMPLPFFPKGAGWYFQQFLKYAFAFHNPSDEYYLIWDADTVPLRPMRFFDDQDRMIFTKATEHHEPYFETYRSLLGTDPKEEFSFISQHMLVQKSILREMLARIEALHPESKNWAWAIMDNLRGTGSNLFSEYETLGHYIKEYYPEKAIFVDMPWFRLNDGVSALAPTEKNCLKLSEQYVFSAFEAKTRGWRRYWNKLHSLLGSR